MNTHAPYRPRAFTLIELLVVVAIISILAAIAVPNFLDAQIRAKVARMKNDMRAMTIALETYAIDNNGKYPIRRNAMMVPNPTYDPTIFDPNDANYWEYLHPQPVPDKKTDEDPHFQATQLSRLTTPIAYMNALYPDLFDQQDRPPINLIDYWDPVQTKWFINLAPRIGRLGSDEPERIKSDKDCGYLLVSVGPDGYLGVKDRNLEPKFGWPTTYNDKYPNSPYQTYDASNGTISIGNIFLGPQMGGLEGTGSWITRRRPEFNMH